MLGRWLHHVATGIYCEPVSHLCRLARMVAITFWIFVDDFWTVSDVLPRITATLTGFTPHTFNYQVDCAIRLAKLIGIECMRKDLFATHRCTPQLSVCNSNDIPIEWQLLMAYMVINSWSTMRFCNRSCFLFPTQHLAGLRYCALTSWPPKHKSLPSEKRHLYTLLIMAMGECQNPDIATSSHVYI